MHMTEAKTQYTEIKKPFNVTIEKGVKYWEVIISDNDCNYIQSLGGFRSIEEAREWADNQY